MSVVQLFGNKKSNSKPKVNMLNLEDYFIDDVEVSALNFILPYQDIKVNSIESLITQSILRPLKFCANLYDAGVYSENQLCPWGDSLQISNQYRKEKMKLILLPNQLNFYEKNINFFKNNSEFFRDCLNQYIQGFLDDFNGVHNLPFVFSPSKSEARKIALKNGNEGILEVISKVSCENLNLGFSGVCDEPGLSQTLFYKNK